MFSNKPGPDTVVTMPEIVVAGSVVVISVVADNATVDNYGNRNHLSHKPCRFLRPSLPEFFESFSSAMMSVVEE